MAPIPSNPTPQPIFMPPSGATPPPASPVVVPGPAPGAELGSDVPDVSSGAPDVTAVPASGGAASTVNEVANLYRSLTGKTLSAEDRAKLEAAIASNGGLTREEFNEICRAHFTQEAWDAFTGGYPVTSMGDLLYFLREFEDYSVATGNSFEYFAQCTEITISDELTSAIHSMSDGDLATMCATHSDIASRVLGHVTGSQIPDSRTQEEEGAEFDYAVAIAMLSDQQKARFEKMMAAALLNDMNNYAERHGMDLDDLNLRDPLMSRMFGEQVFTQYAIDGTEISEDQFNALKETMKSGWKRKTKQGTAPAKHWPSLRIFAARRR